MGFMSYNLNFYANELQRLESHNVSEKTLYRVKQLLKMLDDLADEGYNELSDQLEKEYQGVSRLRRYLKDNNTEPFILYHRLKSSDVSYEQKNVELSEAINCAVINAKNAIAICNDVFIGELIQFCEWIGYEEDTAYVFLLRDTLLPYIYYQNKRRTNIYPWLLGRKALSAIADKEFVDDEVRASIFNTLEYGQIDNFDEFCNSVLPSIKSTLNKYPEIENCLTELLKEIKETRIVVIESGCTGTFPMLLMSLDSRVDMRMYTTYPYLLDIYRDRIFTPKYEENRLFETLYSQNLYFRFSDLSDGYFYVNKCLNTDVQKRALEEIKTILG